MSKEPEFNMRDEYDFSGGIRGKYAARYAQGFSVRVIPRRPSIFLSHSSRDKFFVRELAERLQQHGIGVWLDEAEINVGDSLTEKIGEAIDDTDYVGVVLSHNSVSSEWVQRELQIATQKELHRRQVVILPILLEPVEVPAFLRDKRYADFTTPERFESSFTELLKAVGVEGKSKEVPQISQPAVETVRRLSPVERQPADFEDLQIVGLDEERSYKPDPSKLLFNLYLRLSNTPPPEWQQIFEAERRFPRHTMWRRAWVDGSYIVIHCVPDELEKYHLADLREDVNRANHKYRQYLTELLSQEARRIGDERKEREQLSQLKQRLNL